MGAYYRTGLILAAALLQVACPTLLPEQDSRIKSILVEPVVQGDEPIVNLNLVLPPLGNKRVQTITAEFRSAREFGRPWIQADGEFQGSGNNWTGTLPALNLGPYEVRLIILLRNSPSDPLVVEPVVNELILSNPVAFDVGIDTQECFDFRDDGNALQGWGHGGYRTHDGQTTTGTCPESLFRSASGISAIVSSSCLPDESVRFDMVTPNIEQRPGWSNSQGVVLFAGSNMTGWLMQPILQRGNDQTSLFPQTPDGSGPMFYPLSLPGGSVANRFNMDIDSGPINRLRVRFFSPPFNDGSVAEGFHFVRAACPLPDRPG
ncbi:MAG: hypothetical protein AAF465_09695 [Pseudomonadota bacterium]